MIPKIEDDDGGRVAAQVCSSARGRGDAGRSSQHHKVARDAHIEFRVVFVVPAKPVTTTRCQSMALLVPQPCSAP